MSRKLVYSPDFASPLLSSLTLKCSQVPTTKRGPEQGYELVTHSEDIVLRLALTYDLGSTPNVRARRETAVN